MLYELVMKYTLRAQECNNRFHYSGTIDGDEPGGAEDLTDGFVVSLLVTELKAFWTNIDSVDFHTVTTRALYDETDFDEAGALGIGGNDPNGASMASAYALGFRTDRFQTGRNRGSKRFSGYGEGSVDGNDFTSPLLSDAVAVGLGTTIIGGTLGNLYRPRVFLLDEVSPGVYDLFPTETEQRANMSPFPLPWTANTKVTTQRSRLPGHGA